MHDGARYHIAPLVAGRCFTANSLLPAFTPIISKEVIAMKLLSLFAATLLFVGGAAASFGQAPITPGKEHEWLKQIEGDWEIKMEAGGASASVGTSKYKMGLGGLWLVSDVAMDMQGMKFEGHGLDSYDAAKKKYVAIWTDSMSASPLVLEGDLSADQKVLTMTGKGPGMDGKPTDYKTVTEYKDKNTHTFKMWSGNLTGEPMMTLTYTRKK